jgi:hypothetical protein
MLVCVCNNIKASELKNNPALVNKVGNNCGLCNEICAQCGKKECEHNIDIALLKEVSYLKLKGLL